ncbi:hypothetical protein [uncultured Deefgea sp.]|uniref:hypothetical protein n=1 Tax=uncultured Deefgea sp. TaxID=1304914 RepID=UPI002627ECB7|nr:hypothetical protein [uncultured Deefgea sp.]
MQSLSDEYLVAVDVWFSAVAYAMACQTIAIAANQWVAASSSGKKTKGQQRRVHAV